eukprot:NODE_95_length_21460_cov_0.300220.p15 type:complete len:157 gc:universal NODE_95_length_21460_cov_0.300220:594-1064(+)
MLCEGATGAFAPNVFLSKAQVQYTLSKGLSSSKILLFLCSTFFTLVFICQSQLIKFLPNSSVRTFIPSSNPHKDVLDNFFHSNNSFSGLKDFKLYSPRIKLSFPTCKAFAIKGKWYFNDILELSLAYIPWHSALDKFAKLRPKFDKKNCSTELPLW